MTPIFRGVCLVPGSRPVTVSACMRGCLHCERNDRMRSPIVAEALVRSIGHASSHPGRVLFPGNVVPRRNVALEEVDCGSVTGPSAHSDSGDQCTVKW